MNSRSTHLTEYTIKQIIADKYTSWKSVNPQSISITRLAGLTNITYQAEIKEEIIPKTIVFREFGNAEGFVDSKQERIIFKTISDLELGPKQLQCGDIWRMEEFVTDGIHPNNQKMASSLFQFQSMGVLQKFHQMDIPIPNNGTSLILNKTLSDNMKINVIRKIQKRDLYTDVELKQLENIESFLNNDDEFKYLQEMIAKENNEELKFCHNDLNQLNIFSTSKIGKEIVFIDYEYCSYNYPSYDIANFLNESAINYQYVDEPYYALVDDNFESAPIQAHFLALCYLIHQNCQVNEINQIVNIITQKTNKNKDELNTFISLIKQILEQRMNDKQIIELFDSVSYLKRRIRRLQIISNLNWVWWSVLLAHEKNSLNFEYIDYGFLRFKIKIQIIQQLKFNVQLILFYYKQIVKKKRYEFNLLSEIPYFKYCQKLGGVQRKDIYVSPTKAATFLHLIKHRCDKESALKFAQRRICKWDTTIKQDGPSKCRILQPKENKEKRIHGWQNVGIEMYYENKDTIADINQLELDQDNDAIQKEIEKNEMRLKNDFKNKIAHLQQFYRELNQKYSFSCNDPNFKEKITIAKQDLISKRNQPIKYIKTKGMKYIELFNEINQNKKINGDGLFNRLQVFNQLKLDDLRVKEKLLSEIFKYKKESQSVNHKELQHDINIYENIEEQSEQMLKIIDQNNDFSMRLRKNDHKLTVSQRAIAFAEDFNRTKYLFNYSSKNQMQKMFEIPEIPPPSRQSIKLRKNLSSPISVNDNFDNCLNQYAHEVLEYQQEMQNKEITTDNLQKMLQKRNNIRCSQIRKISKTSHSHQPSVHLDFSKVKCQHQSSRDKESTKAGNSFNIKQRSYLVSPFSKS